MTQREARAALTSESNYRPPSGVKYENIGFVTPARKHRAVVKKWPDGVACPSGGKYVGNG